MEPGGCNQPTIGWQIWSPRNPRKQAKTVAVGCDQLREQRPRQRADDRTRHRGLLPLLLLPPRRSAADRGAAASVRRGCPCRVGRVRTARRYGGVGARMATNVYVDAFNL